MSIPRPLSLAAPLSLSLLPSLSLSWSDSSRSSPPWPSEGTRRCIKAVASPEQCVAGEPPAPRGSPAPSPLSPAPPKRQSWSLASRLPVVVRPRRLGPVHLIAGDPRRCRRPDEQLEGDGHEAASNCCRWCSFSGQVGARRARSVDSWPPSLRPGRFPRHLLPPGAARGTAVSASARQPQLRASRVPRQGPPLHQESPGALVLSLTSASC